MHLLKRMALLTFLLSSATFLFSAPVVQPKITIIPTPVKMEVMGGNYRVGNRMVIGVSTSSLLPAGKYLKTVLSGVTTVTVQLKTINCDIRLELSKEITSAGGYQLFVDKKGVIIKGADYSGIISGISTLRQLLPTEMERTLNQNKGISFSVPFVRIWDAPRFGWRGLMLDSSRHFWTVNEVKQVLDLMAFYKLDRFHWHLTDDQGWRIEIKKYPLLTQKGAWRKLNSQDKECLRRARVDQNPDMLLPSNRLKVVKSDTIYGGFYTQQNIRDIVAYATQRGIEVVPEIDMPGHFMAAIAEYPDVACSGLVGWGTLFSSPICPGKDSSIEFCENIYREVFKLFPSKYIHMGGDEVDKANWKKCADCQKRVKSEGLKSPEELQAWFVRKMESFFKANGKHLIGWDEVGDDGLTSDATIMWWRGWSPEAVPNSTASGKHAICTPTDCVYFDYQEDQKSISKILAYDPTNFNINDQQKKLICGVQANLWTEWIPTLKRMEYMLFPRLIALSEIAWSQPANKLEGNSFYRQAEPLFRRMDMMGISYRIPDLGGFYKTNAFIDSATITLQSQLPSIQIRYTTDGSMPESNSSLYTQPIAVRHSTNFRFRTFRPNGSPSDCVDVMYVKDTYANPDTNATAPEKGLIAAWYDYAGERCSEIDKAKKNGTYVVNNVSIPAQAKGNIGLVITGYLDIPADGIYTFALESDDGSTLCIDGNLVVDNDMAHSAREIVGQKALRKGLHPIEVKYFDHNGGMLKLCTFDKSGNKIVMDSTWFRH